MIIYEYEEASAGPPYGGDHEKNDAVWGLVAILVVCNTAAGQAQATKVTPGAASQTSAMTAKPAPARLSAADRGQAEDDDGAASEGAVATAS